MIKPSDIVVSVKFSLHDLKFLEIPRQSSFISLKSALLLALRHIVDKRVLFIVGNSHLRAYEDHELANRLAIVHQKRFRLPVQKSNAELSIFVAVIDRISILEHIIIESATIFEPGSFGRITVRYEYSIVGSISRTRFGYLLPDDFQCIVDECLRVELQRFGYIRVDKADFNRDHRRGVLTVCRY